MEFISIIIITALIIGSYTDLKTREVPDWLNYGLIFIGLGIHLIFSLTILNFTPFLESLAGFGFFLIIALLMFYTGQWGGGDSKMLMALGALIGLQFVWNNFLLKFFFFVLIIGAVYGIIWGFILALKNFKTFSREFKKLVKKNRKKHLIILIIAVILVAVSFLFSLQLQITLIALSIFVYLFYYLWYLIKSVENVCMIKKFLVSDLTEGEWIAKPVKIKGKIVLSLNKTGITQKDINVLKKSNIKKVWIKQGIPFVPSFLIAYVLMLILNYFQVSLLSFL